MDEVDRIAATPTDWQDATKISVTMTKVTVAE
jgi:peptidyl-prolyl cis-trans isomerase B (cyclophilin B)